MDSQWTSVKVFSATTGEDRNVLGERLTQWLASHPQVRVVEYTVTQSSDDGYHCLAITIFYDDPGAC